MANNLQKLGLQTNLNQLAVRRASELIQKLGKALPCIVVAVQGNLVLVKFDLNSTPFTLPQITIPRAEGNWVRSPIQPGDTGITLSADAFIDRISGRSPGIPDLTPPPNLSALVFQPVSSVAFPSSPDANAALIQGPNGAIVQTASGASRITVDAAGIRLSFGGSTLEVTAAGVLINGINFSTHVHGGVASGDNNTTGPL